MIKNWITVAWRNIKRQRVTSILNSGGLALGITGSLVLFLLINHLLSIDKYHENADSIYRIVQKTDREGKLFHTQGIQPTLPDAFREDFQEIEHSVFIKHEHEGVLLSVNHSSFGPQFHQLDEFVGYTENSFFDLFDREILKGNKEKVLTEPNQIVISEKLSKQLFPDEPAIGKQIKVNNESEMVIVGVMDDFPKNTDFPFDIFISYSTIKDNHIQLGWHSTNSNDQFYFILPQQLSLSQVDKRLSDFQQKYIPNDDALEKRYYIAQPLKDIHFDEQYGNFSQRTVGRSNIYAMAIIGFFLILTGCINYINLSTAVAMKRAKEVGVRKVLGGTKGVIVKQFISETLIITLFSIVIALGLTELLLQVINPMLELELSLDLFNNINVWVYLIGLALFITFFAGIYPSFVLSAFQPVHVLKKIIRHKRSSGYQLRRALVVFQFVISQIFIIGTVVVLLQMNFIKNKDMGFTTDAIVNITLPSVDTDKAAALKNNMLTNPSVEDATLSYSTPASGSVSITNFDYEGKKYYTMIKPVEASYTEFFDIKFIAGRGLTPSDSLRELIVNEKFAKEIGFTSPEEIVGTMINFRDRELPIVGVVADFHTMSLKEKIEPLMMYTDNSSYRLISARINSSNLSSTIEQLEDVHREVYPEYVMEYEFFEEDIANFYNGERKMASILGIFSFVAIFIGCIGLYGLISYVTQQKIKEVGIRKVLGASVGNIVMIFSREFIILIVIAFAIAAPLAGMGMGAWLQKFQYKIDFGFHVYLTGILVTLLIAMVTVGFKTMKAAAANPADSLNNE